MHACIREYDIMLRHSFTGLTNCMHEFSTRVTERGYGTRTQSQLVARARFLTCPKNAPFRDVTPEVCLGAGTPPKLNIPKRCRGKRFSRSGCPKRAVTGNGRARGRACGARAPWGATSKPLRNPHVAPPTTLPDVTAASRGPLVCMTRYGMASEGR